METRWFSPAGYVTGDPSLELSYPFDDHPWTLVKAKTTTGVKWISFPLGLPEGLRIESVTIGYEVSDAASFISQVRLTGMGAPNQATVIHDDPTALNSTTATTHVSMVGKATSAGNAVTLHLGLSFQSTAHSIKLGALGVSLAPATVRSVNTVADLRLVHGSQGDQVSTSGYYAPNDGGGGIFAWDAQSIDADDAGTIIKPTQDSTGGWVRILPIDGLSVKYFGAKGDGRTDDTAAIQATINHALRNKIANVFMPSGVYSTSGPIHLGYGHTFATVNLIGADSAFAGDTGFPGVTITARFSNAPAIVVQGGRNVKIKNVSITGMSYRYGLDTWGPLINKQVVSYEDVSDPKHWVTNVAPSGLTRYAPYAGIAIDPYSGPQPAVSYPNVSYPSWTSISSQYNKPFSSNTTIENVTIDGFFVGIANQPCGADGNGDFTTIRDAIINNCSYAVSVGNSQSRNVGIYNSEFQYVHTILSTDIVGQQNGRIGGPVVNCSASQIYQLFSLPNSDKAGPVVFESFYVEEFIRLGVADVSGASTSPIVFNGCTLIYAGFTNGEVTGEIYNVPFFQGFAPLSFNSTNVLFRGNFGLVSSFWGGKILLKNSSLQGWGYNDDAITSDAQKLAYNYLLGGAAVLTDDRELQGRANITPLQGLPDPYPSLPSPTSEGGYTDTVSHRSQIHRYVRYIQYGVGSTGPLVPVQMVNTACPIPFGNEAISPSFDPATLRLMFDYLGSRQGSNWWRIEPGCILWHQNSNTMFVVDTVAPSGSNWQVSATMVTNYRIDSTGKYVPIVPVLPTGYLYLYQTFHKSTTFQYRGDTTAGSPVISNVRRSDGYSGGVPLDFKVGDLVFNNEQFWDNHLPRNARVIAVSDGSITLDKNLTATALGVPIELYR
ncbi:hypothetical protein H6F89_30190 [Cyanobacteria bacterium FACHB-63]|nr:hypothetical protein [Cyanobacteria bacterium FACHB-63]